MKPQLCYSLALFVLAVVDVRAGEVESGKQIFTRFCAECHAPGIGHPGTQRLGQTRGPQRAVLEERKDLKPVYVTYVVRHGLLEMPPFRPTEIDDRALRQLGAYLSRPH